MNTFKQRLIHLHHCRGATWNIINAILKKDPQLKLLYQQNKQSYLPNSTKTPILQQDLQSRILINKIQQYKLKGIQAITIFDPEYPNLLREIYNPPWVLYARGNLSLLTKKKLLSVVGSREASIYGKKSIELLFPPLIKEEIVIVSGLALGIDAYAHKTAINLSGHTIGVIAGGFYHLYPKENISLAEEMMEKHLVISEYPPTMKPEKWQFPMRNRIISGLSHGTLIIEAKKSSGSLITANYAVHEGREVFAVPGHIFSPCSVGTNELIQQGAKLVQTAEDIIEEFLL